MSETRELELFLSDWPSLRPHFVRGALFIVDPLLSLKQVCEAFMKDERLIVEQWLKLDQLRRPTEDEDAQWSKETAEFRFGIVQPFVLVQKAEFSLH